MAYTHEHQPGDGLLGPADILAMLEDEALSADELHDRSAGLAERGPYEQAGCRYLIGLVTAYYEVNDIDHPLFSGAFRGLRSRLVAGGCDLLFCATQPSQLGDPERAAAVERTLERGVDAIISWGLGFKDTEIAAILASGVPAVFIDHDPIAARVGYVMSANVEAMSNVVRHLYETGRRRIAHISGHSNTSPGPDRLLGYRAELSQLGLSARRDYVQDGDYFHRSGYAAAKRLLELPEPPDAIACASDIMAIAAMKAIEEAGLSVPGDIAVTGFDDSPFATRVTPGLTSVRQDAVGLGTAAAESVLRMLKDPTEPPPTLVLPTELVIRESSGPAATGEPSG